MSATAAPTLYLNRRQAAESCGCSVDFIDQAVRKGDLRARKNRSEAGRRNTKVLFTVEDLRAWVESWDVA